MGIVLPHNGNVAIGGLGFEHFHGLICQGTDKNLRAARIHAPPKTQHALGYALGALDVLLDFFRTVKNFLVILHG